MGWLVNSVAYLGHYQVYMMKIFYENSYRLKVVNYFGKKAPWYGTKSSRIDQVKFVEDSL